jgi:hypothetical protein
VRRLAEHAEQLATSRGIAVAARDKRQRAARDAIRGEVGYHAAWAAWSATTDEIGHLVAVILRCPASTIRDLVVKFEALSWLLL